MQSLVRNNALHHAQAHLRPPATSAGGWSEACRQWTGRGPNTHSRTCDRTMRAFSVSLDVTGMAMITTHRHPAEHYHARPDFLSGASQVVARGTSRGTTGARALPDAYEPHCDRYKVLLLLDKGFLTDMRTAAAGVCSRRPTSFTTYPGGMQTI